MQKFQIRVENSAPSQKLPAQSAQWAAKIFADLGVRRIADLGCGRLRNLPVFIKYFEHITLVDTEFQLKRIKDIVPVRKNIEFLLLKKFENRKEEYDGIFCISVLHIIPQLQIRRELLTASYDALKRGGLLLVDVPAHETYYARRCSDENRYRDGWVMGKGQFRTFYRNYTAKQIDEFVQNTVDLEKINSNSQIKHITRIFQKK